MDDDAQQPPLRRRQADRASGWIGVAVSVLFAIGTAAGFGFSLYDSFRVELADLSASLREHAAGDARDNAECRRRIEHLERLLDAIRPRAATNRTQ